jgi:hypothetical protein
MSQHPESGSAGAFGTFLAVVVMAFIAFALVMSGLESLDDSERSDAISIASP